MRESEIDQENESPLNESQGTHQHDDQPMHESERSRSQEGGMSGGERTNSNVSYILTGEDEDVHEETGQNDTGTGQNETGSHADDRVEEEEKVEDVRNSPLNIGSELQSDPTEAATAATTTAAANMGGN